MTSSWWLASPPKEAWRPVADVTGWPRWWSAMADVAWAQTGGSTTGWTSARPGSVWRALAGWRLRLGVGATLGEPGSMIELRLQGDLQGSATWLFAPARAQGTELTCRWELQVPGDPARLWGMLMRLLFERRHFARMRRCARGMGEVLGCAVLPLREWSGAQRR